VDPSAITVPTTLIGVTSDQIVPIEQLRELAFVLGGVTELVEIDSLYGHDAFLKETSAIGSILRRVLVGQEVSL
jgi:homoserine O-acetyltransferase